MSETAREIAGAHQENRHLRFTSILAGNSVDLEERIRAALGRATERREAYVDLKLSTVDSHLYPYIAVLITRKVPLPPRSGGGVA